MRSGYAAEDGAALHFVGTELQPGRRLAAGGARLPARRGRRAGGRDADRDRPTSATPARPPPAPLPEAIVDGGRRLMPLISRILALGGHDFTSRPPDRAVCELMLRLATERAGGRPRICILPTASGDTSEQIGRFYAAFGERPCEPSDLSLFRLGRRPIALRDHLLAQDLIYVGGGSLLNLLAVWEAHELGAILSLAWRQGIVLAGQSAGAMCWFEAGHHQVLGPARGRRPASACSAAASASTTTTSPSAAPPTSTRSATACPDGYGLDDYAGLLWEGSGPPAAVTARRGARAYRVTSSETGVVESPLPGPLPPRPGPGGPARGHRRVPPHHKHAQARRLAGIGRACGYPLHRVAADARPTRPAAGGAVGSEPSSPRLSRAM